MKLTKKVCAILLALTMLVVLCACGKDSAGKNNSTTATYQVKVVDALGTPYTTADSVIVRFMQDGTQIAMQMVNDDGVAAKELTKGNYTVELSFTDSKIVAGYDKESANLTAEVTSIEVTLMSIQSIGAEETLFVGETEYKAYYVQSGSTYVTVKANTRNYFIFTPTEAGNYTISVNNDDYILGSYGNVYYVQESSALPVLNNKINTSISEDELGNTYVLGLDGVDSDGECVLNIIRTGDATIADINQPWTEYKTTHTPAPYTLNLSSGQSLQYVDVTADTDSIKIVYNDADGYYHYGSSSGPVVLVHLGIDAPYYSLQYIINPADENGNGMFGSHGAKICKYFFDDNNNFIKREDYSDILTKYFENMDKEAGVYPLTDDLKYIIQNGCAKWWDENNPEYNADFAIPDCNPEIGWMFALCYAG